MRLSKPNATILTEGSAHIGFGHITRCLALKDALDEIGIKTTLIVNGDKKVKNTFGKKIYSENWLKKNPARYNTDIIIIDSYIAGIEIYKSLKKVCSLLVALDDNMRLNYPADIVLNGTIGAEKLPYKKNPQILYLLGTKYIPLRKNFWKQPKPKITKDSPITVMITFGSEDILNLTPFVLHTLTNNKEFQSIKKYVVIGSAFRNPHYIQSYLKDKNTKLFISPSSSEMYDIMTKSDIAISAAGQTLYELAFIGVPTLAIAVADNQKLNIHGWNREGFVLISGITNKDKFPNDKTKISSLLKNNFLELIHNRNLREKMSLMGRKTVDGQGARRVAQEILNNFNTR